MAEQQITSMDNYEVDKEQSEREYWKERADLMGLSYPNNIPTEKLKLQVQAKLAEPVKGMSQSEVQYRSKVDPAILAMEEEATKLVRYRIHVLEPSKLGWTGMYITVGNDNLAPVRRAIYFIDEPWHAERIVVDHLKTMVYAHRPQKQSSVLKGSFAESDRGKVTWRPMFKIEELPPLTPEELENLKDYQAKNNTGQRED